MKKLFLALVFSIILLSFISAAPPQASSADYGFELRLPQAEEIKVNTDVTAHMHVFNSSNGVPIIPSSGVSCDVHLYNHVGAHVLEAPMIADSNGQEWELFIDGGNFSSPALMSFTIYCNNSVEGGFVSSSLEVTSNGHTAPDGVTLVFFAIFSIAVFLSLLWSLYIILSDLTGASTNFKTVFIGFSVYITNLAYYYFLINYFPVDLLLEISLIGMSAFGITHLFIPLVGLVFTWIKNGGAE